MAITRTAMVDDDGSGTTGTIINNAWKTEFYNQIDGVLGTAPFLDGPWTPTDGSGAGLAFAVASGGYVKLGPLVFASAQIAWPVTANGASTFVTLPVVPVGYPGWTYPGGLITYTNYGSAITIMLDSAGLHFFTVAGGPVTNANMSGKEVRFLAIYRY